MATVTIHLDEALLEEAARIASEQHKTLDDLCRELLIEAVDRRERGRRVDRALDRASYAVVDRSYTREEMNER